jgi:hypothetical protein
MWAARFALGNSAIFFGKSSTSLSPFDEKDVA